MFYSLQMYFANGGGPCYIVSVGRYDATLSVNDRSTSVALDDLTDGLAAIRKADESTLLVFVMQLFQRILTSMQFMKVLNSV